MRDAFMVVNAYSALWLLGEKAKGINRYVVFSEVNKQAKDDVNATDMQTGSRP